MQQFTNKSTLILNARLNPLAKKPPNGATIEANSPKAIACVCTGMTPNSFHGNWEQPTSCKVLEN